MLLFPYGNIMQIKDTKQLGGFIRTLRKRMRVSQKDLALTSGTGLRFIIDLEKGKTTCHTGKVLTVLNTLGVAITALPPAQFGDDA